MAQRDELIKRPDGTFELRIKRTRLIQRFDATGRLTAVEDRNGNAVTLQYDAGGRLTTVTDAAGRATTFIYGGNGKVSRVVDPANREVTFSYDAAGNLIGTVDMAGNVIGYTYDQNSYMDSLTTPTGTWTITNVPYNEPAFGLVVESITDPLGHTTSYSTPGNVVVDVENPNGIVWRYFPTGQGQLGSMTDPLGNSTQFQYNGNGDLTRVTDALGNQTLFTWSSRGNLTRITDPLGNQLDLTYNGVDNLISLIDPLDNTYAYTYDAHSNLEQITDPAGGVTLFDYDALGQLTALTDARGKATTFTYDIQGNLRTMTTPLGHQTLYTYDGVGRPTGVTMPSGITKAYEWDGIDRLRKITYPDFSEVDFAYSCCQLTSVSGPNGTLSFTYDGAGRPQSYTDVWGNTIGYGLDPSGRLTSLTYPGGNTVTYAYDGANRLTHVTDWLLNTTIYRYDSLGRLTRTDLANGPVTLHAYDKASRLTALINVGPDGSIISRYRYTHDALGNRTGVELYEPVPPSIPNESVTYQYDDDNRLLAANAVTYGYDDDGNLTSKADGAINAAFSYDFEGRLVEVDDDSEVTQYRYDDLGTRVGKTVSSEQTRYVTDAVADLSRVLADTEPAGPTTRYHIHGHGVISSIHPVAQSFFFFTDGRGSNVAVSDVSGNVVNKYGYHPFGLMHSGSVSSVPNSFEFLGGLGVMKESADRSFMRARYYHAGLGRFTSPDPLGLAVGQSVYEYSGNDPINRADPDGRIFIFLATGPGLVIVRVTAGVLIGVDIAQLVAWARGAFDDINMEAGWPPGAAEPRYLCPLRSRRVIYRIPRK